MLVFLIENTYCDCQPRLPKEKGMSNVAARAPMHLLEPKRLLGDEGLKRTVRFIWNIVRDHESRE